MQEQPQVHSHRMPERITSCQKTRIPGYPGDLVRVPLKLTVQTDDVGKISTFRVISAEIHLSLE